MFPIPFFPVSICTQEFLIYIPYSGRAQNSPAKIAFLQILSNLVILNTLVPISLYVRSVNIVCTVHHVYTCVDRICIVSRAETTCTCIFKAVALTT